jgi:predicted PolB exonuclease-like 3'-5' exonuclease
VGIPFKQTGEGDQVKTMFEEGKLSEIEHYCYEDVLATYIIWLNLRHTFSDIKTENYKLLHDRAVQRLKEIQGSSVN